MTLWKFALVLVAGMGIVAAFACKRYRGGRTSLEPTLQEKANQDPTPTWLRFPVFAGDRFGDDWGRV